MVLVVSTWLKCKSFKNLQRPPLTFRQFFHLRYSSFGFSNVGSYAVSKSASLESYITKDDNDDQVCYLNSRVGGTKHRQNLHDFPADNDNESTIQISTSFRLNGETLSGR